MAVRLRGEPGTLAQDWSLTCRTQERSRALPSAPFPLEQVMQTEQIRWNEESGWHPRGPRSLGPDAQLVLVFGSPAALERATLIGDLKGAYPRAELFGCSTAGEICGTEVTDNSLVATAVRFTRSSIEASHRDIGDPAKSREVGRELAHAISHRDLRHTFVLSDGLGVNGSELVAGLREGLPAGVGVTGGLSADGSRFQRTLVVRNQEVRSGVVAILGFYGRHLTVGCGSLGGWDPFGPERLITKSAGNVLYELDGKSALSLYKQYLGEHAAGLPATGLLFPLSLRMASGDTPVVRTILSVDERQQSMTFAGDVPEGAYARLMKANFDRLVDGATGAARVSSGGLGQSPAQLAVLISCVGRKLVLQQRVEEEVEAVREVLGDAPSLTGFYSYGEISPFTPNARCELHNQTMTITTLAEAA